jgi:hypothetical protein
MLGRMGRASRTDSNLSLRGIQDGRTETDILDRNLSKWTVSPSSIDFARPGQCAKPCAKSPQTGRIRTRPAQNALFAIKDVAAKPH